MAATAWNTLVVIGASAGGIAAVQKILGLIDDQFQSPIVVILHLPENMNVVPSLVFHSQKRKVLEARDKTSLEPKTIYLAPGGYHLLLEKDLSFSLSQDAPVFYSRPSIDVAFESIGKVMGAQTIAILLTGANADGAHGLKFLKERGAFTMVQDPQDAEVATMPTAALDLFKPDFVGSLNEISETLSSLLTKEPS